MTASVDVHTNPFNEKCHHNPIFDTSGKKSEPNDQNGTSCMMPSYHIYDFQDNMTAMTNGISSTPGAPIIEISKSPNKSINNINQHTPKKNIGVYREKESNQQTARGLKRYKILSLIGDGTYGLVYLATNVETGEKVAIKSMKRRYHSWDEVTDLREVKSLKKLHHPNVVKLKEVIRENSRLYFIFEYVRGDLLGLMREKPNEHFPEFWIRSVIQQVLQGLSYMHRLGFFHRDLKPENILATTGAADVLVKIADFGLAREIRSAPPFTDYVSTRWYRAPEVLLRSTNYNSPIDIWAVGCITSELYTKRPLFPGTSEIDQLYKIASILGTPGRNDWPDGYSLAGNMQFKFPTFKSTHLTQVLGPRSSARAVSFLYALLTWNPSWRSSAQEALRHSYFRMGKPSSNGQNNSETPGSINSISSKMSGLATCENLDVTPKLSLNLRPKALLQGDPHQNQHLHELTSNLEDKYSHTYSDSNFTNNQGCKDTSPSHQNDISRIPLPMTEIEPHYSRDSYISPKGKKKSYGRLKHPVDNKTKDMEYSECKRDADSEDEGVAGDHDDDDDFADLISAISLGGGANFDLINQSPKMLRSSSTPTKHLSRSKRGKQGSRSRNHVRRNSKGLVGGYSAYGGGESVMHLNQLKSLANNMSDRISNLSGFELVGEADNSPKCKKSPSTQQSGRRFSIHQRKGKDVKACLNNQTYSDLGGIAITSTTEDLSLLDQLRNLRINGFRSSNINCIKVVTPYMARPSNKMILRNHIQPNHGSPKNSFGNKINYSLSQGSSYQPQFGNNSPKRKTQNNKTNGSIPKPITFSPGINGYKDTTISQRLVNLSPFCSLPQDFNVTVSGVGAGRPEKISLVAKQDKSNQQASETVGRSKKKPNTQEREDELNSITNGGSGLVVEKIGGSTETIPQSSVHQAAAPRDIPQLPSDKKYVHVRTDWAAKYLK